MPISFSSIFRCLGKRGPVAKDNETLDFLRQLTGYTPKNISLFELALTHKSVILSDESGKRITNERLEYLGDAAIGLVVGEALYHRYPNKDEGFLTRARARIVCRPNLNDIARRQLNGHVKSGVIKVNADNVFGNALEAFVGAIYLDGGFEKARNFIRKYIIVSDEHLSRLAEEELDFKSRLLEWGQSNGKTVEFRFLADRYNIQSDSHSFVCEVYIDNKPITQSAGKTKKEAQQSAAKKTLVVVKKHKN